MSQALIVIDMQYDNFADSGMSEEQAKLVIEKTNQLISYAKANGMPVYIMEHISINPAYTMFATGTKGAKTHVDIGTKKTTTVTKHYPNSFRETTLQELLDKDNTTDVIISGAMTHMCVDTTVRAANDLGYNVTLVSDACFTKDLKFGDSVVRSSDVQVSYIAALQDGFCEVVGMDTLT